MLPWVVVIAVSKSPFLFPPVKIDGSLPPTQPVLVSVVMASATKTAEMMLGSAAAAGVRVGGIGGAPATGFSRPQLKMPPPPLTFAAPAGHELVGDAAPELAQSYVVPAVPWKRMLPSFASQVVGAASTICAESSIAPAATPPAMAATGHLPFLSGRRAKVSA